MRITLNGTREECAAAVAALRSPGSGFDVEKVTDFRPNNNNSTEGRLYVHVGPLAAAARGRTGGAR